MSTYKLKKHIKTKKIKHFKIPFFGHQLLPQWYTAAYQKKILDFFCKIPSYKACMSTYKLKKHIKTKKIKYFKIPFFGHQLLLQWYTAAYQKKILDFFCKIPSYKACMSTYKLKKHRKTKKIKHIKIPFFGHQLLPQWYTAAYQKKILDFFW